MHCNFCFRNKKENYYPQNLITYKNILKKLSELNLFKYVNFAGGEPSLFKDLNKLLDFSKKLGFSNSIITNGYFFANNINIFLETLKFIDCFGLSLDSLNENVNLSVGRCVKDKVLTLDDFIKLNKLSIKNNVEFKLNTVVGKWNIHDDSLLSITKTNALINKWKFLCVHSNNEKIKVSDEEFNLFVERIKSSWFFSKVKFVLEKNNSMLDSYIMVDGLGKMYCNQINKSKYINIFKSSNEVINFIKENLDINNYELRYISNETR